MIERSNPLVPVVSSGPTKCLSLAVPSAMNGPGSQPEKKVVLGTYLLGCKGGL